MSGISRSRRRLVLVIIAALGVLVVAGQAVVVVDAPAQHPVTAATLALLDLLGAFYAWRTAQLGPDRAAWRLIVVGRVLAVVTNAAFEAATAATGPSEQVWWWCGALAGTTMYAALALGVVSFPARRLHGRQRAALAAEAVAILGGGFMFTWYFVLQPYLATHPDPSLSLLTVGFPMGDLLLLIAISTMLLRGGLTGTARPLTVLVAGVTVYLIADTAFDDVGNDGNHATGPLPATVGVVIASLLMTTATIWQHTRTVAGAASADDGTAGSAGRSSRLAYFPYVTVGLGYALMVAVTIRDDQLMTWGGLVIGLIVMTGAVAVRQLISLRESRHVDITDTLTGLPNRIGLHQALSRALHHGHPVAVLLFDLDGFKHVNELHGHAAGDAVLTAFADTLRAAGRVTGTPARISGDEFAVLLAGPATPGDAVTVVNRVLATAAATPLRLATGTVTIRASAGVAAGGAGDDPEDVLHRADIALYHAKRAGTHGVTVHHPGMLDQRADDDALGDDLDHAVTDGQLTVLYQPMVDLRTGRPRGVEALVRWQHPTRGLVPPLTFIPVAERTGTITAIGLYVLEQACRAVRSWQADLPDGRSCYASVNIAPRQLQEPTLVDDVLAVLDRTGLPPADLVLEVTESALVDGDTAIPALTALRHYGIRIAVDDFGTGYSSLHYLTRMPVDILKIDRSFVAELDGTPTGSAITEAVIRLSRALHLTTVAEGIETPAQAAELTRLGSHTGQGYLFAGPLVDDDARRYLTTGTTSLAASGPAGR